MRPATKEQVESLGGTFVAVIDDEFKNAQTAAGYAKEMSTEYQAKQAALIAETIKKQDIVITTALIPGPQGAGAGQRGDGQDDEAGLGDRRPGGRARAAIRPLTKADQVVDVHGVTIMGHTNLPGALAVDASTLYARNLFNFVSPVRRQEDGRAEDQLERRDHQGLAA